MYLCFGEILLICSLAASVRFIVRIVSDLPICCSTFRENIQNGRVFSLPRVAHLVHAQPEHRRVVQTYHQMRFCSCVRRVMLTDQRLDLAEKAHVGVLQDTSPERPLLESAHVIAGNDSQSCSLHLSAPSTGPCSRPRMHGRSLTCSEPSRNSKTTNTKIRIPSTLANDIVDYVLMIG